MDIQLHIEPSSCCSLANHFRIAGLCCAWALLACTKPDTARRGLESDAKVVTTDSNVISGYDSMPPIVKERIDSFLAIKKQLDKPLTCGSIQALEWVLSPGQNDFGYSVSVPDGYVEPSITLSAGTITNREIISLVQRKTGVSVRIADSGVFEVIFGDPKSSAKSRPNNAPVPDNADKVKK